MIKGRGGKISVVCFIMTRRDIKGAQPPGSGHFDSYTGSSWVGWSKGKQQIPSQKVYQSLELYPLLGTSASQWNAEVASEPARSHMRKGKCRLQSASNWLSIRALAC